MEPELQRALIGRGGNVRFGLRLVSLSEDIKGVYAVVEDPDGIRSEIACQFLVGADGGLSTVRRLCRIESDETPADAYYINIVFRADLADRMEGRSFGQCEIQNDRVSGLLIPKDNATEWSFHLRYDPTNDPKLYARDDYVSALRAAIGDESQAVEILANSRWNTAVHIAKRYRFGRCFLAGDAAHVVPPWGGLNGNAGVADAHNLAWKLALAVRGGNSDELLDSYELERRPVAVRTGEQARLRSNFDARFEIESDVNQEEFHKLLDIGTLLMRNRYASDLVVSDQFVCELFGQVGTRFPHAWIELNGEEKSTLDLFGRPYVLLQGGSSDDNECFHECAFRGVNACIAIRIAGT
jgi:putative polyketide hydroxylase